MAGIPAAITVNKLMPRTPTNAAICITSIFVDQIYPIKFQGNPVNSQLRTHSINTQITENKSTLAIGDRRKIRLQKVRSTTVIAIKIARPPDKPNKTKGINQL